MSTTRALAVSAICLVAGGASAWAESGYEGDDLSLRLASAFTRFSEVSAFGGATVANRWSSAMNPATAGWPRGADRSLGVLAGYWSPISLDAGSTIDVVGGAGLWATPRAGSFQLIASQVRSDREADRLGLVFDYETDTVQAQWGQRFGRWGAGLSFNYATSEVTQTAGGLAVRHSTANTYRVRAGALFEPRRDWLLGAVVEHAWSPFEFTAMIVPPVPPLVVSGEDTQTQDLVRLGVSRVWCQHSTLSLDYQYGRFDNDRGRLETHRFSVGLQQQALGLLFLRAAAAVDQHGNFGWTLGTSAALGRTLMLDVAWQHDGLPELEPDFGGSDTLQFVLSLRF